jgi:hypothetical protein
MKFKMKQAPCSRALIATPKNVDTHPTASNLFDDETAMELNGVDPFGMEELAEIAHDREADELESENLVLNYLDEVELEAEV